jgi:hypothetical protein
MTVGTFEIRGFLGAIPPNFFSVTVCNTKKAGVSVNWKMVRHMCSILAQTSEYKQSLVCTLSLQNAE